MLPPVHLHLLVLVSVLVVLLVAVKEEVHCLGCYLVLEDLVLLSSLI
jgi:hypothetical protein